MSRAEADKIVNQWAIDAGPETRRDPEDFGLDRADGWGVIYTQPGGKFPELEVFNQLFCELTGFFKQVLAIGGVPWDARVDYVHPAMIIAGDHRVYLSVQDSGPATEVADPRTSPAYWRVW